MGKNIVLCSDGTGNKGGYTPDSNVYKIYKAIDIHNKDKQQITFYDNGIGTETNKYVRAAAGALGLGFKTNVCDLYAFLARNYEPGDQVYLFGFSRDASTIRAFAGFIATCGLVDGKEMKEAYRAYVKFSKKSSLAKWTLIFVTTTLVSQLFLRRNGWIALIGYLFVLATALGLSGLLYNPAIKWASIPMGIGIALIAVVFTFCLKTFLREF